MQSRAFWERWGSKVFQQCRYFVSIVAEDVRYADVPKPCRRKSERKPYPTPMKVLIRRAKKEKIARNAGLRTILEAPDNGLLVPELVEVAHQVNQARESLLHGLAKLVGVIVPVKRCSIMHSTPASSGMGGRIEFNHRTLPHKVKDDEEEMDHVPKTSNHIEGPESGFRGATHVWKKGGIEDVIYFPSCYHLYDRVGKPRVVHNERLQVPRLPAVLELCIQAGLDHEDYQTKRRSKPVYWIDGRMADFEEAMDEADTENNQQPDDPPLQIPICSDRKNCITCQNEEEKPSELSAKILESWYVMRSGAEEIMKTYGVSTCGYCPEVQVGPKGHKVRCCRAAKHQYRQGQHAWQEATIDDLIGPNYVWHVRNPHGPPLINELKRYYGKAPAVVELCVQAGAPVPHEYRSMVRLDVVPPDRDEVDLVA